MLNVEFFNNDLIRKYTTVFGTLFNDIYIHRVSVSDKSKLQVIPVPILHSPAAKHVRLDEKNPITTKVQTQLPRIGYQMTGLNFNASKATNPLNKNKVVLTPTVMKTQWVEVPYNLDFQVRIYAKTADDANQIVGQILPFFRPSFVPTVNLIPEMGLKYDLPVQLTSVDFSDEYEGGVDEPRIITWTMNFSMLGYFFGPISNQGVIKRAIVDLINIPGDGPVTGDEIDEHGRSSRITVIPGLTADGQPTTNEDESIPYQEIEPEDPYGYITKIEVFEDGLKWDQESGQDK